MTEVTLPNKILWRKSESRYINLKLSSFSFAKNFSAVTNPLAPFIKSAIEKILQALWMSERREQHLFYLRSLSALSAMPVLGWYQENTHETGAK